MKAVFLDRDGVINEERGEYVKSWEEFSFIPGAKEAIKALTEAGYFIIVITNQAGIRKGIVSKIMVDEINRRMVGEIEAAGGRIKAVYVCPHKANDACECRKPKAGLFKEAIKKFKIEPRKSFVIGDSGRDIEAGKAVGCQSVLINGRLSEDEIERLKPKFIVSNLKEAVVSITTFKEESKKAKIKKRRR